MSVNDIALKAGVSQATVSKVINNYPTVSAESVARVRKAMRELNYEPLSRTRRVKEKSEQVPLVALLIFPGKYFQDYRASFVKMIRSIEESLREKGMDLIMAHVSRVEDLPASVRHRRVQGVILQGGDPGEDVLKELKDIPSVWVSSHRGQAGNSLLGGNEDVGRVAAEYLVSCGHKRLGVINTMSEDPVLVVRCRYFQFVAENAGCQCRMYVSDSHGESWSHGEDLDMAAFEKQVDEQVSAFLADKNRPTGIFVPVDFQLAMVYRILQRRGVQIGKNLDFIGSDEEKSVLLGLYPRPATIEVGPTLIGMQAVKELCWRMENLAGDSRLRVSVAPRLVPGEKLS
ncbi:LacI family DNA-binding transcriptional regulator [Ruficoccus amylovorans]|uniref:LacI family DNA-binding transcriptional regulator n=1 Tax=Ruficoccus amylovorans TaxID=1804625 RepID=A0A842HBR9_9BACT|nr:LacI family DNA-binding transcriptional regulator [Ruficoccus amylovorans]MBC2593710.1 LacI family DNA-binding transcriptional regulator [Ruficoccus amylovorans]